MEIEYHRDTEPATIRLQLTTEGFDVVPFEYGYAGFPGGLGAFFYRFRNGDGDVLTVATSFGPPGYGRARVAFVGAGGGVGNFNQCWDTRACLTYVDDLWNLSCPMARWPCSFGTVASCPTVPTEVPIPLF
jgi:hypothetical protein